MSPKIDWKKECIQTLLFSLVLFTFLYAVASGCDKYDGREQPKQPPYEQPQGYQN